MPRMSLMVGSSDAGCAFFGNCLGGLLVLGLRGVSGRVWVYGVLEGLVFSKVGLCTHGLLYSDSLELAWIDSSICFAILLFRICERGVRDARRGWRHISRLSLRNTLFR